MLISCYERSSERGNRQSEGTLEFLMISVGESGILSEQEVRKLPCLPRLSYS